jgi:N-acetylglucosaminyldiphosphoundecaprenol N-acetyl-beta-D-mannosaminyltransferase
MQPDGEGRILGSRVDPVDMDEAQHRVSQLLAEHRFAHVVTFGSEMAMLARRDPAYREVVNSADLVVPDTIGVVYAARMLGMPVREQVAGVELVERLCAACAADGVKLFLLGGAPGVAEEAGAALRAKYPALQIVGTQHGYFNDEQEPEILERIRSSGARLVLVALGFPRQEIWSRRHAAVLGPVVCMGVGGSLDIISGRVRRAPHVMRALGLEWLYRLASEPKRLRRQLALPQFAVLVAGQALRQRLGRNRSR